MFWTILHLCCLALSVLLSVSPSLCLFVSLSFSAASWTFCPDTMILTVLVEQCDDTAHSMLRQIDSNEAHAQFFRCARFFGKLNSN